jgi:NADH:ubiquinone reductase (H+-translocating)
MTAGTQLSGPHRVVIIGGGFGGLPAARWLGRHPVDVTLIDRRNHHLFQPLLYQVATGMLSPGQIAPPIRHVLRDRPNVRVELAEVVDVDVDKRVVHATVFGMQPLDLPYDSLIVAAGSNQSYFGNDGFALQAPGMKTVDDALELRRRIFGAFEIAEMTKDPVKRAEWLTFAVVGAGPTGVEVAGQLRELAVRCLRREFRSLDPADARVILIDGGKEPLANFGDRLSERAARTLERLGVELKMGLRVVGVDDTGVEVIDKDKNHSRIKARTMIWAAGVQASPLGAVLAKKCGAEVDRAGRVKVLPDLSLPGHPEVFCVGDMTSLDDLPGVAEVAMQGGLHAANTIVRRLDGNAPVPFKYRDLGSVATLGRFRAVASIKGVRLSGFPAWVVWMFVHLTFLEGFGNRVATMSRWLRSMVGRGRAEREFPVAHVGGDLSLPEAVRRVVQPDPFPLLRDPSNQTSSSPAQTSDTAS